MSVSCGVEYPAGYDQSVVTGWWVNCRMMSGSGSRALFAIFLCLATATLYYWFFFGRAQVDLVIDVDRNCWFKIYWAAEGEPFAEKNMARVRLYPDRKAYHFILSDLRSVGQLRIDPFEYRGEGTITSIRIHQKGFEDIVVSSDADFAALQANSQVRRSWMEADGFHLMSSGDDPQFLLVPATKRASCNWWGELVRVTGLCALVLLCYRVLGFLVVDFAFVPVCLAIVLTLVITMALVSRQNVHPDEFVHVGAVTYYTDHWLPPRIDDQEIRDTYSPYGVSRLNSDEAYYFVAGKFGMLTGVFCHNRYICARLFGVFLLLMITLYTVVSIPARLVALPFLLTPQVWYLFSYCNSDQFALALAFVAGCQLVRRESFVNNYLLAGVSPYRLGALTGGSGLGLLLLTKHNYLAFVLFLAACYGVFLVTRCERGERLACVMRLALVVAIGLAMFGSKKGVDVLVNGLDRDERVSQLRIELADERHTINGSVEKQLDTLYMKKKGVTLRDLVATYRWHEKTFRSAVGVYGYFSFFAHTMYYTAVKWAIVILLGSILLVVAISGNLEGRSITMVAITLFSLLTAMSLYHSWVADFQPQGRYLFPVVGMLGIILGLHGKLLSPRWLSTQTVLLFLLSCYSFICIGLHYVP